MSECSYYLCKTSGLALNPPLHLLPPVNGLVAAAAAWGQIITRTDSGWSLLLGAGPGELLRRQSKDLTHQTHGNKQHCHSLQIQIATTSQINQ